jgi:fructose/tagatose bisphosphate aldolase
LPPYDELFASGKGFTDPEEAGRFVAGTGVDWLSVAIGNIHGAVSGAASKEKKLQARLNLEHLDRIREQARVPLVLHGGSGIRKECLLAAFRRGIAKINVGTTLRQAYEQAAGSPTAVAQQRVYEQTVKLVTDELEVCGSARVLNP